MQVFDSIWVGDPISPPDKALRIAFVTSDLVKTLVKNDYSIADLGNDICLIVNSTRPSSKLDANTITQLALINKAIAPYTTTMFSYIPNAESEEVKLIEDAVYNYLNNAGDVYGDKKYYGFTVTASKVLLVIVEEGFLKITTESKDEYELFLLDVLGQQYQFSKTLEGFDCKNVLSSYLNSKLNDNYLNLVKLMA